jgi:hypothetical protein
MRPEDASGGFLEVALGEPIGIPLGLPIPAVEQVALRAVLGQPPDSPAPAAEIARHPRQVSDAQPARSPAIAASPTLAGVEEHPVSAVPRPADARNLAALLGNPPAPPAPLRDGVRRRPLGALAGRSRGFGFAPPPSARFDRGFDNATRCGVGALEGGEGLEARSAGAFFRGRGTASRSRSLTSVNFSYPALSRSPRRPPVS